MDANGRECSPSANFLIRVYSRSLAVNRDPAQPLMNANPRQWLRCTQSVIGVASSSFVVAQDNSFPLESGMLEIQDHPNL